MDLMFLENGLLAHAWPMFWLFVSAFLQSITGFGLVIIGAPLMMLFYDAKLTVVMMLLLSSCANLTQSIILFRQAHLKTISWLLLGTILGQPIGCLIYHAFSPSGLHLFVSIVLLLSLLAMQFLHIHFQEGARNSIATGIFSGILTLTTGMGGPPLIFYFAYTTLPPAELRATCICYFMLNSLCSLLTFFLSGTPISPAAQESLWFLPMLFLGIFCGSIMFRHVSAALFRQLIVLMLAVICLYSIVTAYGEIQSVHNFSMKFISDLLFC